MGLWLIGKFCFVKLWKIWNCLSVVTLKGNTIPFLEAVYYILTNDNINCLRIFGRRALEIDQALLVWT